MPVPEWLFGPAGDLRPLPAPDMNIKNTVQRFGGVHSAVNGARTVDVLGHRAEYSFELPYLTTDEYPWLEALYTETIPGPFYLVDPLRKNLLSREAGTARPSDASGRGLAANNNASLKWVRVTDTPVSWLQRGVEWSNINVIPAQGAGIVIDSNPLIPVKQGDSVTLSVYVKMNASVPIHWILRYFDESEVLVSEDTTSTLVSPIAGEWVRVTQTFSGWSSDVVTFRPELWYETGGGATSGTSVQLIGFQAEYGNAATDVGLGGGSVRVAIDSMDTTSPYYPLQSVSLNLMEV